MSAETFRKLAHIAVGFLALLAAIVPPGFGVALAFVALVHNVWILPRYARILWRTEDHSRGYSAGVVAYSLALVALSLIWFDRQDLFIVGWAVLAFADGFSTLGARAFPSRRLPWHSKKTWSGFVSAGIAGTFGSFLLLGAALKCAPDRFPPRTDSIFQTSAIAGSVAAFVESIPLKLDDNLTVPLIVTAVVWGWETIDEERFSEEKAAILRRGLVVALVSLGLASAALASGMVSLSGCVAGWGLSTLVGAFGGWGFYAALVAFVVPSILVTRWGQEEKGAVAVGAGGEAIRSPRHAFAKLLVPAGCALLAGASSRGPALESAGLVALAFAAADTWASEWGCRSPRSPRSLIGFHEVLPGTPGAVSGLGLGASLLGALFVVGAFWATQAFAWGTVSLPLPGLSGALQAPPAMKLSAAGLGVAAGVAVALLESLLGGLFTARGLVGKSSMNFACSGIAAYFGYHLNLLG